MKGKIIASVAGDYSVLINSDEIITCKARGLFRLKKISPCVGDFVTLAIENNDYVISEIAERKNSLVRPPLANLDCVVIVVSSCEPRPNPLILDRLTVIFEHKNIPAMFVFTKVDKKLNPLIDVYQSAGFDCFIANYDDNSDNSGIEIIKTFLRSKTSALIGNSGVGKTTLLNKLAGFDLPTAAISRKLGRGKHTTRTVELHRLPPLSDNTFVADTPGFSTVESRFYGEVPSSEAALYFREFVPFVGKCCYGGCTHNGEDGCAICGAVEMGEIERSRYDSYVVVYDEARKAENQYN